MSKGGSKSSSTSTTTTTTEQVDKSATGTDNAVVLASDSVAEGASVNIEQIPPAVLTVFQDVLMLAQNAGEAALQQASETNLVLQEQANKEQSDQKMLLGGMLGIVAIMTIFGRK